MTDIGVPAEARVLPGGAGQVVLLRRRIGPFGNLVLASRGPVWRDGVGTEARGATLRLLARDGLRLVEAEGPAAAADMRGAGYVRLVTPVHVAELDLTGGPGAGMARTRGKWRNRLQQARAMNLSLCEARFDPARHGWLLAAEAAQRRARRYHGLPAALTLAWAARHPAAARVFWAELAGQPLAGMLMLRHGPVATYHLGWSGDAGRRASAHHLILMQAARWLADAGVQRLDLGTIDTETAPGLARFKIGAGAEVRPLGGSWLRVPFCGTGKPATLRLWGMSNSRHADVPDDPDDPFPMRGAGPAPDRPAADHRAGAGSGR